MSRATLTISVRRASQLLDRSSFRHQRLALVSFHTSCCAQYNSLVTFQLLFLLSFSHSLSHTHTHIHPQRIVTQPTTISSSYTNTSMFRLKARISPLRPTQMPQLKVPAAKNVLIHQTFRTKSPRRLRPYTRNPIRSKQYRGLPQQRPGNGLQRENNPSSNRPPCNCNDWNPFFWVVLLGSLVNYQVNRHN